jgi:hypothetical protein
MLERRELGCGWIGSQDRDRVHVADSRVEITCDRQPKR